MFFVLLFFETSRMGMCDGRTCHCHEVILDHNENMGKNEPRIKSYVVGIDEVGRGALAGPVVVGVVMMPRGKRIVFPRQLGPLKDSKKLSARQRLAWFEHLKNRRDIFFTTARVYPCGIEKLNISKAANRAAANAFRKVCAMVPASCSVSRVCLDGGLYLGNTKNEARPENFKNGAMAIQTIVKGDEKIAAIKIASIVAKVSRDRYMARLAKKYPEYGFEVHKGYGTKAHFEAIRKYGPSIVHRTTFL